jgi:hypothetical protein
VAINEAFQLKALGFSTPTGLATHTSREAALRWSSIETEQKSGKSILLIQKCVYFGEAGVSEASGDAVIEEAVGRIRAGGVAQVSELEIFQHTLEIRCGGETTAIRIKDISAIKRGGEKGLSLGMIEDSRRLDRMTCHALMMPESALPTEGQPSVRQIIVSAQEALYNASTPARKSSFAKAPSARKTSTSSVTSGGSADGAGDAAALSGQLIGNYEAAYLGTESVPEPSGQGFAEAAVVACMAKKTEPNSVFLQVSTEGLFIIDALTYERDDFVLADVSFSSVCGKNQDYFVFFQKDESLRLYACG